MCNVSCMCILWKERSYYYLWIVVFISNANIIINEFHQDYHEKLSAYHFIIFCIRTHIALLSFVYIRISLFIYTDALVCMQKL